MTNVNAILADLQSIADKQVEIITPKPEMVLCNTLDGSVNATTSPITLTKEFMEALNTHVVLSFTQVERNGKMVNQNEYGLNRIMVMPNSEGQLILVVTSQQEIFNKKTARVNLNGTVTSAIANEIHASICEHFGGASAVDAFKWTFKPSEIFLTEDTSVCVIIPHSADASDDISIEVESSVLPIEVTPEDFQEKLDRITVTEEFIPETLESLADKMNGVEPVEVVSMFDLPTIPSAEPELV